MVYPAKGSRQLISGSDAANRWSRFISANDAAAGPRQLHSASDSAAGSSGFFPASDPATNSSRPILAPDPAKGASRSLPAADPARPFPIRRSGSVTPQVSNPLQVREAAVEYGACPDPFTDADALEEIEEEVVTLAAHIHAATRRLLSLIAEFDRRRGWELGGHRSCAHWLAFRTGMDLGAAREKVRAARALEDLPKIGASMARGELSFSKVRALTRVANPTTESDLLELARGTTAHQLERMIRAFRRGSREEEGERDRRLHESRSFSVFPDEEGMYLVKGRLPAEVGALLMRAVEAASDQLFREEGEMEGTVMEDGVEKQVRVAAATLRPVEDSRKQAAQRRADALGLMAERALAAGFGDGPVSGSRAGRYQVMLHVDERTLREDGEESEKGMVDADPESAHPTLVPDDAHPSELPDAAHPWGRSELEDGTRVSAETSRRLACDCGVVRVEHGLPPAEHGLARAEHGSARAEHGSAWVQDGSARVQHGSAGREHGSAPGQHGSVLLEQRSSTEILNVGRRTRSISPALRRALEVRDGGCRFPGCGSRYCDAHHVRHWADGGETSLTNCLLLCRYHHRLVHEEGWTVEWWGPGRPAFRSPRGWIEFEGGWRERGSRGNKSGGRASAEGVLAEGLLAERGLAERGSAERASAEKRSGGIKDVSAATSEGMAGTFEKAAEGEFADLATALVQANEALGIIPDGWTPSARWKREVDIPEEVQGRADEAILEGLG